MITIRALKLSAAASCLAMAILAYVPGCTQNSRLIQDQYRLEVTRVSDEPQTQGEGVLKVRRFAISNSFETREFITARPNRGTFPTSITVFFLRLPA